ncbi:MAG TPA: hypothetical protein VJN01_06530, partial [Xanthomonadales bacterium]|nr:hypothetical protein [Xanthomonadales bacterium]
MVNDYRHRHKYSVAYKELTTAMHIVADENIPGLQESFGQFGNIQLCNGRSISSRELQQAEGLLIRSVSRINRSLLVNSSVRFLGSATIGIDHLDIASLD